MGPDKLQTFITVDDMYEPLADGSSDNIFISASYDSTTHFESTFNDINSMYKRITGKELQLDTVDAGDATKEPE